MGHMHHQSMVEGEHSPRELAKFIAVIAAIAMVSLGLAAWSGGDWPRWFMGTFFLVFAGFKLAGYSMFVEMFAGYDVLAKRSKLYSQSYPFIELGLAFTYLANFLPGTRDWFALVLMAVSAIGVAQEIRKRSGIHCACLGNIIKLPLSTVSLVEDVGMGAMAIVMLVLN